VFGSAAAARHALCARSLACSDQRPPLRPGPGAVRAATRRANAAGVWRHCGPAGPARRQPPLHACAPQRRRSGAAAPRRLRRLRGRPSWCALTGRGRAAQARLDDRLLDLFPPHKRTLADLESHFMVRPRPAPRPARALHLLVQAAAPRHGVRAPAQQGSVRAVQVGPLGWCGSWRARAEPHRALTLTRVARARRRPA